MQRRSLGWVLAAALSVAACQTNDQQYAAPAPAAAASVRTPHGKPRAPVDLRIETRPAGGTRYDVTLTATPSTAVKSLELVLDGRTTHVGNAAAGRAHTVTTRIDLGQVRGREIVGSASVDMGSHRRRAAAAAQIGEAAPAAELPYRIVRLPDGSEVAEVRP